MDALAFHLAEDEGIGPDVLTPNSRYERTVLAADDGRKGASCSRTAARGE